MSEREKQVLREKMKGYREINRITDEEARSRTYAKRWEQRKRVQALVSLLPKRPHNDPTQPRQRWTRLREIWLERNP